ncbi:NHL repeat-containing protein [Cognaticolwellia mytili]|uniref:hypothetical protein n=1 Tax=Cognaticolwellia mytili TaxID=1888913 RepID=UPI00117F3E39|nr:hypothetical protein [Cognaticolwellia mytili]
MDRRKFIISGSAIASTLAIPMSSYAKSEIAGDLFTKKAAKKSAGKTRLSAVNIRKLGIKAPLKQVIAPGGQTVQFPLNMRIARQYQSTIYVWFETEPAIRIYDQNGVETGAITLPESMSSLKDFALDTMGNIFILAVGEQQVSWISAQGDILGTVGEFGIDLADQLNGATSLTIDAQDRLHVLNTGSRTIKVFKNNGVYLFEYGQSRWGKERKLLTIDGTQGISASGGMMRDSLWHFSLLGQLQ